MKKRLLSLVCAGAVILSFSACGKDKSTVAISLPEGEDHLTLAIGDEITLGAQTKKGETVTWSCDDETVAIISPDGRLSGKSNGVAVVTAKTESGYDHAGVVVGNGVKGTVTKPSFNGESRITNVSLSYKGYENITISLSKNEEIDLEVNVIPADCDDPLEFSCDKPEVLEVDNEGHVTPISKGTAIVTATAPNGVKGEYKIYVR